MPEVISDHDDEGNPVSDNTADEVNPDEANPGVEDEGNTDEVDPTGELSVEESAVDELPAEELLVEEVPHRTNIPRANDTRNNFAQRRITIRYGIQDNPDRGSRNLPEPKHLVIKLPDAFTQSFPGVWVAERGEEVFVDFFPRNDQNDRTGYKRGDGWRWIKVKDNGEIAMGISRPYTKSRSDGELVRDYRVGAFKLVVPLHARAAPERAAEDQPGPRF